MNECAFDGCSVHQLAVTFSNDEHSKICRFMQAAIKQSQLAAKAGQVASLIFKVLIFYGILVFVPI